MSEPKRGNRDEIYQQAWEFDQRLREDFGPLLCGVDEAGRGPLAGPVVAAAVILPDRVKPGVFFDSKQLSKKARQFACDVVLEQAVAFGIGVVDHHYIDQYNILQATQLAMGIALEQIQQVPDLIAIDGMSIPGITHSQRKVIHGDALSQSIGAASILAKETRDNIMQKYDVIYPEYGFSRHMGYGTKEHLLSLDRFGPSPIHRMSFAPVKRAAGIHTFTQVFESDSRKEWGRLGEDLAVHFLEDKGFLCLERNWRVKLGEIDAIMRDGDFLVFVEVRSRHSLRSEQSFQMAAESVNEKKINRLRLLALWYVSQYPNLKLKNMRVDVVLVHFSTEGEDPMLNYLPGVG